MWTWSLNTSVVIESCIVSALRTSLLFTYSLCPTIQVVLAFEKSIRKQDVLGSLHALFSSPQKLKFFQDSLSHQILRHMYGALNIDENKTNCTVCL